MKHALTLAAWAALALALVTIPTDADAQGSNFGTVRLAPGFTPDPHVARGTSGGAADASNADSSCTGWISSTPDHILVLQRPFDFLRIFAESDADTTLVIQTPRGQMRCDDDTYGLNPSVEGRFPAGTYRIWIGSYQRGVNSRYQLKLTELHSVRPGEGGGGGGGGGASSLDLSGRRGNFAAINLETGFVPDPHPVRGRSGGQVNANALPGSCTGWIARRPDHVMTLSRMSFVRVFVRSDEDTTLVIRTPDGRFICDDDTNGLNPQVDMRNARAGRYLVWVGSYEEGEVAPYRLGVTELSSTNDF